MAGVRRAELLWTMAARSQYTFNALLGLRLPSDNGALDLTAVPTPLNQNQTRVTCDVPGWLCTGPNDTLTLSGAAALIDEVSTFGGMTIWDAGGRPGVSTHLELEAVSPHGGVALTRHDRATIVTTKRKAGRTIGFLDVEIIDAKTGQSLARGSVGVRARERMNTNKSKNIPFYRSAPRRFLTLTYDSCSDPQPST